MDLIIKNAYLVDPAEDKEGSFDIGIKDGKVSQVASTINATAAQTIDANGKLLCPGLIDMHVHFREPGFEYKETVHTGCNSAAAGGFTSVACMANTSPVNDNATVTEFILSQSKQRQHVNVFPIGAISEGMKGEMLANIGGMVEAGAIAISDDGLTVMDTSLMRKAMEYSKSFNTFVIVHAEDEYLSRDGDMNEGALSTVMGLKGNPNAAEEIIIARDIALSELTGCHLHVAHVSTKEGVHLIREAKKKGLKVTAEVTPHHLVLTEETVAGYKTNAKMRPPLRAQVDVDAVRAGLKDGTIDVIATDHAPHSTADKEIEFALAQNGIVGLETAVPLTYSLVKDKFLTLKEWVASLTCKPAQILNLPNKGTLKVGADADFVIIDVDAEYTVDRHNFFSKSDNTPFHGWKVTGKVLKTGTNGKIIYEAPC
jgi:dihydroorotase